MALVTRSIDSSEAQDILAQPFRACAAFVSMAFSARRPRSRSNAGTTAWEWPREGNSRPFRNGRPHPLYFNSFVGRLYLGTSERTLAACNVVANPHTTILLNLERNATDQTCVIELTPESAELPSNPARVSATVSE